VDAVALSSVIVSGLVGIAGIAAAVVTSRGARQQTERIAREEREHQRRMARGERVQERRSDTYVAMLEMVGWVVDIVDRTQPIFEPSPPPPEEPDMERVRLVQARIGAHGSREVKELLERWASARNDFFFAAQDLARARQGALPADTDLWRNVTDARAKMHELTRELEDRVNAELAEG